MTADSRSYTGPGAAGAVANPGRNAAGTPQTPGPGAAGADNPKLTAMNADTHAAVVLGLARDPTATVGTTDLSDATNDAFILTAAISAAQTALTNRGASVNYGAVLIP